MPSSEKPTEKYLKTRCDKLKYLCWKLTVSGVRGVPDRLVLCPGGRAYFIELKDTGKSLDPLQKLIHRLLNRYGFDVLLIDSKEKVNQFIFYAEFSLPIPADSDLRYRG